MEIWGNFSRKRGLGVKKPILGLILGKEEGLRIIINS